MKAKDKAKKLIDKYLPLVDCGDNRYTTKIQKENAKQCALITVNEIIKYAKEWDDSTYLEEIKQEIELL